MLEFDGLRTVAEDAARQPVFADIQHRAARRVRRRRIATGAGTAAALVVAALVANTVLPGRAALPAGGPTPTPPVTVKEPGTGRLGWLDMYDAGHLYAIVLEGCQAWSEGTCRKLLRASDDGGRTWRSHALPAILTDNDKSGYVVVTGPRTLYARASYDSALLPLSVSTDGGATWRAAAVSATPASAVPPGGVLLSPSGVVQVLDPGTATIAPLAAQPPVLDAYVPSVPAAAGLWVTGRDRDTRKPAVAVSTNSGRTWATHVFDAPAVDAASGTAYLPHISLRDGRNGYAWFGVQNERPWRIHRLVDGVWRPFGVAPLEVGRGTLAMPDGTLVITRDVDDHLEYQVSRDGGPFQPVTLNGLPNGPHPVGTARDGSLYAPVGDDIYVSTDGWTYRKAGSP